jgi:flavin-dependent dehydrogenase
MTRVVTRVDIAVVGAGPAGLAVAIHAARRGLRVAVFERQATPVDKACGEGLLSPGLRELEELGARAYLTPEDCSPIVGIRYLQEDGTQVEGRLPTPGGLGIRRLALEQALLRVAREAGVRLLEQCPVERADRQPEQVLLTTAAGAQYSAGLLVAADGLHSPLRRAHGLEPPEQPRASQRFGLRQHFQLAPWTDFVEVHFARGVEAYVTPAGRHRVGVAFLWRDGQMDGRVSFRHLLRRFPVLEQRLADVPEDSRARGAGPLLRTVRRRTLDRFVLVGDAAGYVDAITGEGLTLALRSAAALGRILPESLARGASQASLAPYERAAQGHFRRYAFFTNRLLELAGRPRLRTQALRVLARTPATFEALLHWVVDG